MTPTTRRVTRDPRRLARRSVQLATARATVAVFAAFAAVWAVDFVDVVPREIRVIDSPVLVATFFFDTLATNESGIHKTAVFHPALTAFGYLQTIAFMAAG